MPDRLAVGGGMKGGGGVGGGDRGGGDGGGPVTPGLEVTAPGLGVMTQEHRDTLTFPLHLHSQVQTSDPGRKEEAGQGSSAQLSSF